MKAMLRRKFIALYINIRSEKRSQTNNQEPRKNKSKTNLKREEEEKDKYQRKKSIKVENREKSIQ